jgi:hypothetical protein
MSIDSSNSKEKLEQKLGEALGLEMAAQKAVKTLSSKGLLSEYEMDIKLEGMREEASNHQRKLEQLVQKLGFIGFVKNTGGSSRNRTKSIQNDENISR